MLKDHPDLYFTKADKPFVFRDLSGFTPDISRLVFMLDFVRRNTLNAVRDLSVQQLDIQVMEQGNTIGMLLAHIAHVEQTYQSVTFRAIQPTGRAAESVLGDKGRESTRGCSLMHYLDHLRVVRTETFRVLAQQDDAWLQKEYAPWPNQIPMNNFFCWFHVLEDEINHVGQIRILRKEIELLCK